MDFEKKLLDHGFSFDKLSIGLMCANGAKVCKMLRKMYGTKYQIVALYDYVPGADVQLYDLSPFEWAYSFRYFKFKHYYLYNYIYLIFFQASTKIIS